MKILLLTDVHGQTKYLYDVVTSIKESDLVVLAGDITNFRGIEEAREIIDFIQALNNKLFAISGNCDKPEVENLLAEKEVNLHRNIRNFGNMAFVGLGGSLITPSSTPNEYTEEEYENFLYEIGNKIHRKPHILVAHNPPYRTQTDRVMYIRHVGSKSVRNYIREYQPIACLSGHIHESHAIDSIGNTQVVNPGSMRSGRYAEIVIDENNQVEIELKQIK